MSYSAKDVKHFKDLAAVRNRPTTYVGPVDSSGIGVIAREPLDNILDEFTMGRGDTAYFIDDGKSYWVVDNGGGIPVDIHPEEKIPALEIVISKLNAGAKFDDAVYKNARGTHGIGVKGTNALSAEFEIWTCRKGKWYTMYFEKGVKKKSLKEAKCPDVPQLGKQKCGTILRFTPDMTCFDKGSKLDFDYLFTWAELSAYLNPGFRTVIINKSGKKKEFFSKKGPKEYLEKLCTEVSAAPLGANFVLKNPVVDIAVSFTDFDGTSIRAYTNGLKNAEGGKHIDSFFAALGKAIMPYKLKTHKFTPMDLREGLVGVVNMKMSTPQFNNQPKDKLVDSRVPELLDKMLQDELKKFFDGNKTLAKKLCQRADKLKELKESFKASKKALAEVSKAVRSGKLPPKLVTSDCAPGLRELFIVEGDSALGTAKLARDSRFQEILPLRGKLLNVMKEKKQDKALGSDSIEQIMQAANLDPAKDDPVDAMRVGKIILMTDADVDGLHIATLLNTMFLHFSPRVFEKGMIFIAAVPEYIAEHKGKYYYGSSVESVRKKLPSANIPVSHLKGLGEMNSKALSETAFNPETRRLYQVQPVSRADVKEFRLLMMDDVAYRKKLLGV